MSHIPTNAVPRAAPAEVIEKEQPQDPAGRTVPAKQNGARAFLREHGRLAAGAAAALAVGTIAAVSYPFLRARNSRGGKRRKKS